MGGMKGRLLDGRLQVETELRVGEKEAERPLILLISAGRAERQHGRSVPHDKRRTERGPRALSGRKGVGQPGCEPEHLTPCSEAEAE